MKPVAFAIGFILVFNISVSAQASQNIFGHWLILDRSDRSIGSMSIHSDGTFEKVFNGELVDQGRLTLAKNNCVIQSRNGQVKIYKCSCVGDELQLVTKNSTLRLVKAIRLKDDASINYASIEPMSQKSHKPALEVNSSVSPLKNSTIGKEPGKAARVEVDSTSREKKERNFVHGI